MISLQPIKLEDQHFLATTVVLPKTTLLIVSNDIGYIMCGALDVQLLNDKLVARKVIAGRAVGVTSIDELLNAPLQQVTIEATSYGISEGMIGKDALLKLR